MRKKIQKRCDSDTSGAGVEADTKEMDDTDAGLRGVRYVGLKRVPGIGLDDQPAANDEQHTG